MSVSTVSLVLSGKGESLPPQENALTPPLKSWDLSQSPGVGAARRAKRRHWFDRRDLSAPFYAELTAGLTEALERRDGWFFCFTAVKTVSSWHTVFTVTESGCRWCGNCRSCRSSDDLRRMAEEKAIPVIFASVPVILMMLIRFARTTCRLHIVDGASHSQWASADRLAGRASSSLTRAERVGGYCATLLKLACRFIAIGCWSALPARSKPRSYHGAFTS